MKNETKEQIMENRTVTYSNGNSSDQSFGIDLNFEDDNETIYCANCIHCVLVRNSITSNGEYVLRVRCEEKKWKKKLGEEKVYKFFTVARRTVDSCESYTPMGDVKNYLRDLRKTLPIKDEVYHS